MAQDAPADQIHTASLAQGAIRYREVGSGEPVVFVHGLIVDGSLWDDVVERLSDDFRCIVPDWPLGSHAEAMSAGADLTPPGLARLIADFMEALDLKDVTLVANDTGGALSQIYAAHHPERLGRLVLTDCDAFENFLPPFFRPLQWLARVPGAIPALFQGLRLGAIRRSPIGFGLLVKRPDERRLAAWAQPYLKNRGVRRDTVKVLRGISPRYTLEAAERLQSFDKPLLLAWAREDRFFKPKFAERLAASIPGARLEWIDDSRTFVPMDQPEQLADLIRNFAHASKAAAASKATS
jgi:pimeloyl-ACP methyl ester carboxylesterase